MLRNLPVWACAATAAVYWCGNRAPVRVTSTVSMVLRERRRRTVMFGTGLLVIIGSLSGPMDDLSDHWFWVHMTQHLLLVVVAAPLIVMGAPWLAPWRLIGHRARVTLTRTIGHGRAWAPLRSVLRPLSRPLGAWLAFNVTLLGWHLPVLYNLTLRNAGVHDLEHALLLLTAVLFWAQVLESPPLRVRLSQPQQVAYLTLATIAGWLLALALSLPSTPIYQAYADQHHGDSVTSAVTDQQLAAGMMWVPGSIPYSIGVLVVLYRWLDDRPSGVSRRVRASHDLVEEPR
jgi:putative membrane protein